MHLNAWTIHHCLVGLPAIQVIVEQILAKRLANQIERVKVIELHKFLNPAAIIASLFCTNLLQLEEKQNIKEVFQSRCLIIRMVRQNSMYRSVISQPYEMCMQVIVQVIELFLFVMVPTQHVPFYGANKVECHIKDHVISQSGCSNSAPAIPCTSL